jgi:hypothetical protein
MPRQYGNVTERTLGVRHGFEVSHVVDCSGAVVLVVAAMRS